MRKQSNLLDIPSKHQLRIARDTLKFHCAGVRIMGGMGSHQEAINVIYDLTGVYSKKPQDCSCPRAPERRIN